MIQNCLKFAFLWIIFGSLAFQSSGKMDDQFELVFQSGNKAMLERDYALAVETYQNCLAESESANLNHNMGVSHYLNGETGLAVLFLEKASRLKLANASTQEVLSLIRRSEGISTPDYSPLHQIARSFPEWFWMGLVLIGFWGTLFFGIYLYGLVRRISVYRDLAVFLSLVFIVATIVCIGLHEDSKLGILVSHENELQLIPAEGGETFLTLKSGEMARFIKENNGFVFVESTNRVRGWVQSDSFRFIR